MHRLFSGDDRATFETIIGAAPGMLWLAIAEGDCVYLSPSWYQFTGLVAPAGLGLGWLEPIHPDDREKVLEAYVQAAAESARYQIEYRLRAANGSYRWVLDSAAPFSHPRTDNKFDGYAGSIVDIEERKQAELQRDISAFRANLSVEASDIGLWEWDLKTNLFEFSHQARKIFGMEASSDPLSFEQMQAAIHPDDLDEVRRKSAAALDPTLRASETYEYRILLPDGAVRWVHARGEAIFEADPVPRPVRYIGTFRDVTAAVEQEQRLKQSAERLQLAVSAAGLAIWELDVATGAVVPSVELNRLYGFPDAATPNLGDFQARYAPGETERIAALTAQAEARGDTEIRLEVRHLWPDGTEKWFLIQARKATGSDGRAKVIGVAMDITAIKTHERQLEVVAHELQHRVKNTLSIVQTLANQTFRPGRELREAKRAFGERLHSLARTTERLTQEVGAGSSLCDIVQDSLGSFRSDGRDPFHIEGEPVTLPPKLSVAVEMALHELATNAMKYGALSGDGNVHLQWRTLGQTLEIVWRENGGPLVVPPTETGFGTRLLSGALFTPNEGSITLDFPSSGVVCLMSINLAV
jgi:PAS domain S-box-containing protein